MSACDESTDNFRREGLPRVIAEPLYGLRRDLLIEITSKPAFARDHRQRSSHSTFSLRPLWSASLDWVRQAAALGFDSMEFFSFPSAYQPDLHSKAADSWIVEVRRWASADRLPHGPIVIEFRPPLLGVLGAYCTPAMSGRKTQEHPARPQAQHERSYKPE